MSEAPHEVKRVIEGSEFSSLHCSILTRAGRRADVGGRHRLLAVLVGLNR